MKTYFAWTSHRVQLLSKLIRVLSGNIDNWDAFSSQDGNINYFSDIDKSASKSPEFQHGCGAIPALHRIDKTFEALRAHKQELESLKESLEMDFDKVRRSAIHSRQDIFWKSLINCFLA
jgi:hypothetical protein